MVKEYKKESVVELIEIFSKNKVAYFVDYQGLNVEKITALRRSLKQNNSEMKIFKNTLAILALKETKKEALAGAQAVLKGSTGIVFASEDPVASAKVLVDFLKENESFKIKGAILENSFIEAKLVRDIAALPSKDVLISKLLMLLNSPITGFVNVLQGNMRNFVYALTAIKDKKSV